MGGEGVAEADMDAEGEEDGAVGVDADDEEGTSEGASVRLSHPLIALPSAMRAPWARPLNGRPSRSDPPERLSELSRDSSRTATGVGETTASGTASPKRGGVRSAKASRRKVNRPFPSQESPALS